MPTSPKTLVRNQIGISKEESPHQDKTLFSSVDNNMKLDSFTILLKMF